MKRFSNKFNLYLIILINLFQYLFFKFRLKIYKSFLKSELKKSNKMERKISSKIENFFLKINLLERERKNNFSNEPISMITLLKHPRFFKKIKKNSILNTHLIFLNFKIFFSFYLDIFSFIFNKKFVSIGNNMQPKPSVDFYKHKFSFAFAEEFHQMSSYNFNLDKILLFPNYIGLFFF
jgi:hypothetical protein